MQTRSLRRFVSQQDREFLRWAIRRFGVLRAGREYLRSLGKPTHLVRLPVPGARHEVLVRRGTADTVVFEEVFFQGQCTFGIECEGAGLIVDAGAHVGLTTVFFALQYPRATIVALEPERSNFHLLRANTAAFRNVRAVNAALWHHPAKLCLANPGSDTWTFRFVPPGPTAGAGSEAGATFVEAITMDALLAPYGTRRVSLLKMNIEGAEAEVLRASASWLHRVDSLAVELHDWLRPGCADALDQACPPGRYLRSRSGEFTVLTRAPDQGRP